MDVGESLAVSKAERMTPERWQQIKELFYTALELPPGEREAFLREACGSDSVLHEELAKLFASHEQANSFIEAPALQPVSEMIADGQASRIGQRIGPYQILQEIGQGGMGAVYLAERADQQYQKRVAIKLVRRGLDHNFIVQRFLSERQILAQLDHPNIARLIDGGTTEDGLPYLVMDYIEGLPIDCYCNERQLSTAARLKLFRTICAAVQYAHQNLVIHRDIKPSNILVTADGTAKLLDFGIAKLLSPEPAKQPQEQTATALRLMTPEYASPEQVRGETITTASDIYSLGVLLYKLLTGYLPYRLKLKSPLEIERAICEEQPEKPSTAASERMKDEGGRMKGISALFHPSSFILHPFGVPHPSALRGDLDNVVLKAIRKEPQRRYASVEQFSEDLRRYLAGLPVSARRDTFAYRTGKFIQRHKAGVAATALVILSLIGGLIATAWQARIAARQRDRARAEAAKSEQTLGFLQQMLSAPLVSQKGREVKVLDALDEAAQRAQTELANQPEVKIAVQEVLGGVYREFGSFDKSEEQFRAALELSRQVYGEAHAKTTNALFGVANALQRKGDFDRAIPLLEKAIVLSRQLKAQASPEFAHTLLLLGLIYSEKGNVAAAEPLYEESLQVFRQVVGPEHVHVGSALNNLATLKWQKGDLKQAAALYSEAVALTRKSSGYVAQAGLATTLQNLGSVHKTLGAYAEAEPLLQEAVELRRKVLGEKHPHVAIAQIHLGDLCYRRGEYAKAEKEISAALAIQKETLPKGHLDFARGLIVLGELLTARGEPARGEAHLREALAIRKKVLPPEHFLIALIESALGASLVAQQRYAEAESLLNASFNNLKASQGAQHPNTTEALRRLVALYEAWGKSEQATLFRAQLAPPQP
jgi:eukaryotic-like serine/threonine-protein kinase